MFDGVSPIGSQPSATSAVSATLAGPPAAMKIGMSGFVCRIDLSGLPTPVASAPS